MHVLVMNSSKFPIHSFQLGLTRLGERCTTALLVESAEEIAPYVQAHTLASHVARVRDAVDCQLTLVVFGVKDYFKLV